MLTAQQLLTGLSREEFLQLDPWTFALVIPSHNHSGSLKSCLCCASACLTKRFSILNVGLYIGRAALELYKDVPSPACCPHHRLRPRIHSLGWSG